MQKADNQKLLEDTKTAKEILSNTFGEKIDLTLGEKEGLSERTHVHRLNLVQGPSHAPPSIIMKQARASEHHPYVPDRPGGTASRLFNEWAGLQFLSEACEDPLPNPRFYGGDRNAGIILMEDLGTGKRLDHILRDNDAVLAEKTMIALSGTVGRMHAQSNEKQARYDELRGALGPTDRSSGKVRSKDLEVIRHSFKSIGIKPQHGFFKEWDALQATLNEPGLFNAYIHSDPCPDNCHWVGSDLRLLDFETGQYAHALIDGVYPRIHFPTCWCVNRIPDEVVEKAEAAYRSELVKGCAKAADDNLFYPPIVGACAAWAFTTFAYQMDSMLEKDSATDATTDWLATGRQRPILRFNGVAAAAEKFGHFKAIGETARLLANQLQSLWSDVEEMKYFPAFQSAG